MSVYAATPEFDALTDDFARAGAYARAYAQPEPRPDTNAGYYWPDSIQSDVYRYIVAHPGCGRAEIAEDLHIKYSTVGTCTARLCTQQRITATMTGGMHRAAYYATE